LLTPEKAQNVALAVHELATNSAKYGALSAAKGCLRVEWQIIRRAVALHWQESGGPPAIAPASQGFGTKIMNASIKHQIGGNVTWDWQPTGLHCTLQIPLGEDVQPAQDDAAGGEQNLVHLPTGAMRRVLLAEDEAIIGMMMREFLTECGLFVVGPCCTVNEATAAANGEFDCAILDLNLGGHSVYPVAEMLTARGVPIAFVTGYDRESVDPRFSDVPVLQKPITREHLESYLRNTLGPPVGRPSQGEGGRSSALTA
jgi:CheY-like chemotaxis protein